MAAIRYSGRATLRLTYRDATSDYRVSINSDGLPSEVVIVGEPATLTHAVDSPEAFDDAARAAISFAESLGESCSYDDAGPFVARKRAECWTSAGSVRS